MLSKVVLYPTEAKYTKVRLGNATFQKKVAKVDGKEKLKLTLKYYCYISFFFMSGAIDLFLAAGFVLVTDATDAEEYLQYQQSEFQDDVFKLKYNIIFCIIHSEMN